MGASTVGTEKVCTIEGCNKKAVARGLCSMHYTRELRERKKNPNALDPITGVPCKVEGCPGKVIARGLCARHYYQERRKDPEAHAQMLSASRRYYQRKKNTGE